MFTPSTIKAIQDIMRQDIGVDGDATRLSQMVWLIFLKILDDEDKALEIRKDKFVPTLPEKYQWRTWAAPLDGITGDKLIEFVNNDLLPGLRTLPESSNKRTDLTRMAFKDVYNFMRKGTLLKQVINKINEIDFTASKDRHAFNEVYERLLKSLQSAGNFGEMYTPRAVTQFVVEMVDPKVGESVLDPAVGTGGFLVHTLEHLRKQVKSVKDEHTIQESIHGVEKKPLPYMLLLTNMMLHGIEEPVNMRRGNTLERPLRDYTDADKVTCVVANPPFGGTEEPGIEANFPKEFQTRETADLFLVLIMRLLKKHGRAGIVLPDGTLFGEGMKTSLKKALLEECNLHTIVRLPKSVFSPYTSIATNLLFFTKGEPTKEIWYYEHKLPVGQKAYSMTNPIGIEEFDPIKTWWNNREENDNSWKVSVEEIVKRNYNLDIKNPRTPKKIERAILTDLEKFWQQKKSAKNIGLKLSDLLKTTISNKNDLVINEVRLAIKHIEDLIYIPKGIQHLENVLLTLAVSGQLVSQNKKDGTGEGLFKEIQQKRSKIKKQIVVEDKDKTFPIPSNWSWVRLEDVFDVRDGTHDSPKYHNSGYPLITSKNLYYGTLDFLNVKYVSEIDYRKINERSKVDRDDILFAMIGSIGNPVIVDTDAEFSIKNVALFKYYSRQLSEPNFLLLYLKYVTEHMKAISAGGVQSFVSLGFLRGYPFPLPPLSEQKRIVKKVNEIMVLINQLKKIL